MTGYKFKRVQVEVCASKSQEKKNWEWFYTVLNANKPFNS